MKNLKRIMEQNKESSLQLAKAINVSQPTISRYQLGKTEPTLDILIKIADHYGVTVDYLIGHPTKAGLPISLYTEKQQEAIRLIQSLNDEACLKLIGYVEGMLGREFIPVKQDDDQN